MVHIPLAPKLATVVLKQKLGLAINLNLSEVANHVLEAIKAMQFATCFHAQHLQKV